HPRDAFAGEHEAHRGKRDTHQRRINPVQRLCGTGLQPLNAIAEPHDEADRRQHDQPAPRCAREPGIKPGLGKGQGDEAGQREPRSRRAGGGGIAYSFPRYAAGFAPSAPQVPANPKTSVSTTASPRIAASGIGKKTHSLRIGPVTSAYAASVPSPAATSAVTR